VDSSPDDEREQEPPDEIIDAEFEDAEFLPPEAVIDAAGPEQRQGEPLADGGADALADAETLIGTLFCPTRQALLLSLCRDGPADVTTLAARAGVPRPAASFHLGKLYLMGLVRFQRQGKRRFYSTVPGLVHCEHQNGQTHLRVNRPSGNGVTLHLNDAGGRRAVSTSADANGT
jgi:DNA-binding transcriptional ArsR family regulator